MMTATNTEKTTCSSMVLPLRHIAMVAIAEQVCGTRAAKCPELDFLASKQLELQGIHTHWTDSLTEALQNPLPADSLLAKLASEIGFTRIETLAVALAIAVEDDPFVGRVLARVQEPAGGTRPTLGLLSTVLASLAQSKGSPLPEIINGEAVRTGLISIANEVSIMPERAIVVAPPLCLALNGSPSDWPGVHIGPATSPIRLPASIHTEAQRYCESLQRKTISALVIRAGTMPEAQTVAELIAKNLGYQAACVNSEHLPGFGIWLRLRRLVPVFVAKLGPSERRTIPDLPGYSGPILVVAGRDGVVEKNDGPLLTWTIGIPDQEERIELWRSALECGSDLLAEKLGKEYRHGTGRIAQLGRFAVHYAALRTGSHPSPKVQLQDITAASWTMNGTGLDNLAEPQCKPVPEDALVIPAGLRKQLDLLTMRCRNRDGLADNLGIAAAARYHPGVRALMCGPSGTGKTLAAGWLATRLGLPLYRIDLASVTSKYIGETEKNLSELLSTAEQAEVILLFDEADSLFGKRTDIRDSNDRFANAQTNYLLQRIESYDGIVILTSNSRDRFDTAFTRRLDAILEFPMPDPDERRELWIAHLGEHHALEPVEVNRLAGLLDLTGGQIRNAVLTAAVLARSGAHPIRLSDVVDGAKTEYLKQGRHLPVELQDAQ